MALRMAHPVKPLDAEFDRLANLPAPWRMGEITWDQYNRVWWILVWYPTGPGMASGTRGGGPTISKAIADLFNRMDKREKEHARW